MALETDSSTYTLEELLPHRGRMLLVHEIVEGDETHAVTRSVISDSFPLRAEEGVEPLIMIELAAQTAGVCNGLDRIQSMGKESSTMGWLVGVKRASFFIDSIPVGRTVVTSSKNVHNYENLREVFSEVYLDGALIGEITLQLFKA